MKKFVGITWDSARYLYVAITEDGELWSYSAYTTGATDWKAGWKKIADAPEEE